MNLNIIETDQNIGGSWEYSTDLFDATTVRRFAHSMEQLLGAIVEQAEDGAPR